MTSKKPKSASPFAQNNLSRPVHTNLPILPADVQNQLVVGPMAARMKFQQGLERNRIQLLKSSYMTNPAADKPLSNKEEFNVQSIKFNPRKRCVDDEF